MSNDIFSRERSCVQVTVGLRLLDLLPETAEHRSALFYSPDKVGLIVAIRTAYFQVYSSADINIRLSTILINIFHLILLPKIRKMSEGKL